MKSKKRNQIEAMHLLRLFMVLAMPCVCGVVHAEEAVTSSPPTSPTAAGADSKGAGNEESGSRGSTSAAVDLAGGASWSILHQELSAMRQVRLKSGSCH